MKIKFFGVGAALQPNIGNTHFLIEDGKNKLQVDCGGGLKLAQTVKRGEVYFENLFITHVHTDHFLGIFNLFRTIGKKIPKLNIFCSKKVEQDIRIISKIILKKSINEMFDNGIIKFIHIDDLKQKNIGEFKLTPINLNSTKMEQYGFLLEVKDKKILFFGDEAVGVMQRDDLEKFFGVDYLICEGLIPENQSLVGGGKIDLDWMCHISARQAGRIAKKLEAKNLTIIHTKEQINRVELLKNDAKLEFNGNIFVPNDGEEIEII